MNNDVFENIDDWGPVLEQLEDHRKSKELDRLQEGLIRLLRYRDNWKVREAALQCARELTRPSEDLVKAVLDVLLDDAIYCEARVLAAEALGVLEKRRNGRSRGSARAARVDVVRNMSALLEEEHPPILKEAVRRTLAALKNGS